MPRQEDHRREHDNQWRPAEDFPPLPGEELGRSMERGFEMMDIDHRGHGPQGYQRADERVHADVCDRLTDDRHVDARELGVQVAGGVVTLTGEVVDRSMKARAEEIALGVSGVKEVDNRIRVTDATNPTRRNS